MAVTRSCPIPAWQVARGLLRRFAASHDGATALEFAFAFPVLLTLVIGMIEVAMIMFVSVSVEGGLREAARYGITGQEPAAGTREEQILAIIERHTYGFVTVAAENVTFKSYDSFDDVGQPEPWTDANLDGEYTEGELFEDLNCNLQWDADRGTAGVGNAEDVVLYTVDYDWGLMTPIVSHLVGDEGLLRMSASIVVRNEPYAYGTGGGGGGGC